MYLASESIYLDLNIKTNLHYGHGILRHVSTKFRLLLRYDPVTRAWLFSPQLASGDWRGYQPTKQTRHIRSVALTVFPLTVGTNPR